MADPFSNPEIHARIAADVARIQSDWLDWNAEPTTGDFDTKIVQTLVDTLDAHARAYLEAVDGTSRLPEYHNLLQRVGSALLENAEKRSLLLDPYSEHRLRTTAENTGHIINRRHELTPEQYEAEVRAEVERCRSRPMPKALKWHKRINQLLIRIETRFEARYHHWAAEAWARAEGAFPKPDQGETESNGSTPTHARSPGSGTKGNGAPKPHFPARALWLKDRLLERGWSTSDPSTHGGPDRKTVEKILRGEAVRNDVLEKLADALSHHAKVNVLDIPQD